MLVADNLLVPIDPIWVLDPKTGKQINVRPFLHALDEFESQPGAPVCAGGLEAIQRIIRLLCLTVHDPINTPPRELSNIYYALFQLWDMFEATGAIDGEKA